MYEIDRLLFAFPEADYQVRSDVAFPEYPDRFRQRRKMRLPPVAAARFTTFYLIELLSGGGVHRYDELVRTGLAQYLIFVFEKRIYGDGHWNAALTPDLAQKID